LGDQPVGVLLVDLTPYKGRNHLVHGIKTYPDPTVAIFGLELFKGRAVRLFF
jgi:hypothetical protein